MLFEHSMDGIMLSRPDGTVLTANPAACAILGRREDELKRLGRRGLLAADNLGLEDAMQQRDRTGRFRGILNFLHPDGTPFPAEVASESFTDAHGQTLNTIIFRDVSASQRAAAALLESEARYRTAFMTSPDSITITDLDRGRYLDVNGGFTAMFGWSRDEVVGLTSSEVGIWERLEDRAAFLQQVNSDGGVVNFEASFLTKKRRPLSALVSARLVAVGGRRCVLTVTRDVTLRKRIEVELDQHRHRLQELVDARTQDLAQARDAAEAASVAKSSFLANVSHEIRTPMNAIVGYAHLLEQTPLTEEQRPYLERICAASEHLLVMISDVLELSKIEAGALVLESVDFEPAVLLSSVRALVSKQAEEKGLQIDLTLDAVPAWLRGDPTRLRQAILNLASNAVKFTSSGSVSLRAEVLQSEPEHLLLRFEVSDTGIGIPADQLKHLFQSFHQVDASTTRNYGGTGLGLAITRRLADSMGGQCGVDSQEGVGSRFWFTARLARTAAPCQPVARANVPLIAQSLHGAHAGRRVLVAEDNPINQELLCTMLRSAGLVVEAANNGREAVAMAAAGFDLILMDMQMPVLDGLEATRQIRQLRGHASTPILAVTGNAFSEDRERCIEAGMNDFITKPFNANKLFQTVAMWLSHSRG